MSDVRERAWWEQQAGVMHGITFHEIPRDFVMFLHQTDGADITFTTAQTECGLIVEDGTTEAEPHGLPVAIDCARCIGVRTARRAARRSEAA